MVTKYQALFLIAVTVFIFAYFQQYGEFSLSEISKKFKSLESGSVNSFTIETTKRYHISTAAVKTKQKNEEVCFINIYIFCNKIKNINYK